MEENRLKQFIIKNIKWFVLLVCIVIFWEILENIFQQEIEGFDTYIYNIISKSISEPLTTILKIVTNLGGPITYILISLLIIIFSKNKKYIVYILTNLLLIAGINQAIKFIIQRPRPVEYRMIQQGGYSFPSGHSMVSMAYYGLLIYFIYHKIKNKQLKWTLCIILSILILLIGVSRIYLGVHYASDVIAGFCFSLGYLIIYTKIIKIER